MRKKIEPHIFPKWDPSILMWGMWNERLQTWIGKDEDFGHAIFRSEQEALDWYKEQI